MSPASVPTAATLSINPNVPDRAKADADMGSYNSEDRSGSTPPVNVIPAEEGHSQSPLTNGLTSPGEPLSPAVLRKRVEEMFPSLYLTLVSIIQGVAFGIAVTTAYGTFSHEHGTVSRAIVLGQALVTIVGIILITDKYVIVAATLRWSSTILDTLLPYLIGLGEIGAALMIGHEASWWFAIAFWLLAGMAALRHTMLRATEDIFGGMVSYYNSFQRGLIKQIFWCALLFAISLGAGLLDVYQVGTSGLNIGLLAGVTLGAIIIYLVGKESLKEALDEVGIPRMHLRKSKRLRSPDSNEA
jgi:hypothetical protein